MLPDLSRRPRTRKIFCEADMERMARLYYDPAQPLTRVAGAFGVPVSTFLRWIAEMDWPRRSAAPLGPRPPAPAAEKPQPPGEPFDVDRLRVELACIASRELNLMDQPTGPMTLDEQERRAKIIASLARALEKVDRSLVAYVRREAEIRAAPARRRAQKRSRAMAAVVDDAAQLVRQALARLRET